MSAHEVATQLVHPRRGGTSLVLRLDAQALPCVLHWGPDLRDPTSDELAGLALALQVPPTDSAIDTPEAIALLPQHFTGWVGRTGCSEAGTAALGRWRSTRSRTTSRTPATPGPTGPPAPCGW